MAVATVLLTAGAFVAAAFLAPSASTSPTRGLVWLLFLGSSVHVASTGWLYTLSDVRAHAARHPTGTSGCRSASLQEERSALPRALPSRLTWLLLPYFAWQFFHFGNRTWAWLPSQRRRPAGGAIASSGAPSVGARRCCGHRRAHGAPGPPPTPRRLSDRALFTLAELAFAGAVVIGLAALARRPAEERPLAFCVVYLLALIFSLPVFVFASPYAAVGGMTIAHGFQYLLLVGLVAAGGRRGSTRAQDRPPLAMWPWSAVPSSAGPRTSTARLQSAGSFSAPTSAW